MRKIEEDSGSDSERSSDDNSGSNSDDDNKSKSGSGSDSDSGSGSGSDSGSGSGSSNNSSGSDSGGGNEEEQKSSGSDSDDAASRSEEQGEEDEDGEDNSDKENEDDDDDANDQDEDGSSKESSGSQKVWEEDPDMYGVRRSARSRREPERLEVEKSKAKKAAKRSSRNWHSSDDSDSDDSSDSKRNNKVRKKPAASKKNDDTSPANKRRNHSRRLGAKEVNYGEGESDEDGDDEEDMIECDYDANNKKEEDENTQTIERLIEHRIGKKGAVGMQTYSYEVEKNGDPNKDFDMSDPEQSEMQFLVKWKGWAHLHNTWESEKSLREQNYYDFQVKGLKKVENYLKKEEEISRWKRNATPEEVEYMEIQNELEYELFQSHLSAERVFAEAQENTNCYYYIKWTNLPYSEATWENAEIVKDRFPVEIASFEVRERSPFGPKLANTPKHRPKFSASKMQPDFIGGENEDLQLRDYQLLGMNWLVHSWSRHHSCILADEMGLGKTIQAISFMSYLFHTYQIYGPFLIVVPLSTMNAWQREFAQWAPKINLVVYIGDRDSRKLIRDYEWTYPSKRLKFNAIVTTYEILLRDKEELRDLCTWATVAIDEAHRLKNEESQLYQALREFRAHHRLLITGTPLQNSLRELWALLHFIMPDRFDDWERFEHDHDLTAGTKGYTRLHRQLEPFLLRRVKKDVEKSLPSKVEQILRVDMTSLQRQYYRWILTRNYTMLRKGNRGSHTSFVNIVMELKKCCNHASLTKPIEEMPTTAPEMLQTLIRGSGKLLLLDKLLLRLHETGHRVLIFSQMVRMLDILSHYLTLRRLPFQRLDGSIKGDIRRQALDHFNAEGSQDFCFLLSTRAGGLGINLATADTVVIFDSDWNPQNDLQAQARAHRIGQKNQVNIYRLVTKGSIEENIIERAKQKMVLDHLVIQSMDTSGRTVFNRKMGTSSSTPFNKEELNAILKFGAEELFKDEEENDEEPMCDIDEILGRAETRDEGPASMGDDLLSAFKVASFNLDEEEEVSRLEPAETEANREWDDIIPEDVRTQLEEEERAKEMADLYLPPRKRKKLSDGPDGGGSPRGRKKKRTESGDSSEGSDSDRPKKRGRKPKVNKETFNGFSDVEVRRLVKSIKRLPRALSRLDEVARDADLREKNLEDLKLLGETVVERCRHAMREHEMSKEGREAMGEGGKRGQQRGPSVKVAGVSINAKTAMAAIEELQPLEHYILEGEEDRTNCIVPTKRVKDANWDVLWSIQDDSRLLRGIYKHGMGAWESIKNDSHFNLCEKILPVDENSKPQSKHLESRAIYLLKVLKKNINTGGTKTKKRMQGGTNARKSAKETKVSSKAISKAFIENDDSSDDDKSNRRSSSPNQSSRKTSVKPEAKEDKVKEEITTEDSVGGDDKHSTSVHTSKEVDTKKEKKKKKRREEGPVHITANGQLPVDGAKELDQSHPLWAECKEKMRPMKKALKALDSAPAHVTTTEEQIAHSRQCLMQIGDHIDKTLASLHDPETIKEWKSLLWQFVSKFTEYDSKRLQKLYNRHKFDGESKSQHSNKSEESSKKKKDGHHHHHHHSKKKDSDSKKHKEKDGESKDRHKHKHKHKDKDKNGERSHKGSESRGGEKESSSNKRHNDDDSSHRNKKPYNGWPERSGGGSRDGERYWDRKRDWDRGRDSSRSYERGQSGGDRWHNRDGGRYQGDYNKRDGGYNRDGYRGGYHRGGGEWRGPPRQQPAAPQGSYYGPRMYPPFISPHHPPFSGAPPHPHSHPPGMHWKDAPPSGGNQEWNGAKEKQQAKDY